LIKIKILKAEKGKIYTNGVLQGKVIWLSDKDDISTWYQINIKKETEQKEVNNFYEDFKKKYDKAEVEEETDAIE
jgi:hypothetical protein